MRELKKAATGDRQPIYRAMIVELPLPAAACGQNHHGHWKARWRALRASKTLAWHETRKIISNAPAATTGAAARNFEIQLDFYWRDRRRRDHDNAISRCKGYLDGIAMAMAVDDSRFALAQTRFFVDSINPRVVVTVMPTATMK